MGGELWTIYGFIKFRKNLLKSKKNKKKSDVPHFQAGSSLGN